MFTPERELGYYCNCRREYTGLHCETSLGSQVRMAELSMEGLVAILVCAFLFLSEYWGLIVCVDSVVFRFALFYLQGVFR